MEINSFLIKTTILLLCYNMCAYTKNKNLSPSKCAESEATVCVRGGQDVAHCYSVYCCIDITLLAQY